MSNDERLRVSTTDKKYTVIQEATGGLSFLRHGESWAVANRDWRHCNMILVLAQDLQEARGRLALLVKAAKEQLDPESGDMKSLRDAITWAELDV